MVFRLNVHLTKLLLFVLSLTLSLAANGVELSLNTGNKTFSITWLEGFAYRPAGQSQRWRGPKDELVIVTIASSQIVPQGTELSKRIAQHSSFAEGKLLGLAAAKGSVTRELTKEQLSSGAILYSTATQSTQIFRDYYYLQFFHISPQADVALITVEGYGQSATEFSRYRPLFDSARWTGLSISSDAFTDRVIAAFQKAAPELKASVKDGNQLELLGNAGPILVNLDNVRSVCAANVARCDDELGSFVNRIVSVARTPAGDGKLVLDKVFVVLRNEGFAKVAGQQVSGEQKRQPIFRPFISGIEILYVVDTPNAFRFVSQSEIDTAGIGVDQLHDIALKNVLGLGELKYDLVPKESDIYFMPAGDGLGTARVFDQPLWDRIEKQVGGAVVVCAPTRDWLLFVKQENRAAIQRMRGLADRIVRREPYAVSPTLFHRQAGVWQHFGG